MTTRDALALSRPRPRVPAPRVPASGSSEIRAQFVLRRIASRGYRVLTAGLPAPCSGAARPDPRGARERRRRLDSSRSTNPARRSEKPQAARVSGLAFQPTILVRWIAVPAAVETWLPHEAHPRSPRRRQRPGLGVSATRAAGTVRPATLGQERLPGLLGGKARQERRCHSIGVCGKLGRGTDRHDILPWPGTTG